MPSYEEMTANNLLFKMLDEPARQKVIQLAQKQKYRKGDMIIKQGSSGQDIFLLIRGKVEVEITQEGLIVELNTLEPGRIFGEVAEVKKVLRTASVKALEEVKVLRFPGELLVAELRKHPTANKLLEHIVAHRTKDAIKKTFGE